MFEAMMNRFQEDTVRYLFLMQIVGPDGQPITRPPQQSSETLDLPFAMVDEGAGQKTIAGALSATNGNGHHVHVEGETAIPVAEPAQHVGVPVRAPSTTIDAIERDFMRNKERELEMSRNAGVSDTTANGGDGPRRTGDKIGANAPCPCGSGKKYKKCHGA